MRELIRIGQHSSEIFLVRCFNVNHHYFEKSSYSLNGIRDLRNEYKGYMWYLKYIGFNEKVKVCCDIEGYFKLTIPGFNACPFKGNMTISKCFNFAIKAIDHYQKVWSRDFDNEYYPIHGDFSLEGNILFDQNNVYIIDWEHFLPNAAPIGFDILFMVFELLKIDCGRFNPSEDKLMKIMKLIEYAISIKSISDKYKNNFFTKYLEEQHKNREVWGNQYKKLPTNQFNADQYRIIKDFFA